MNKRLFFILSTGRTGSRFLAGLLNSDPVALVVHEPVEGDFNAYVTAYHNSRTAYAYIKTKRSHYIRLQLGRAEYSAYGEVNGVLRRHVEAIVRQFPQASLFHLVRDGRDVVRSMFSRTTMTARNAWSHKIRPKYGDPLFENWERLPRFNRICWYWATENRYLRERVPTFVQLERILEDYEYLKEKILAPLQLNVSERVWAHKIKKKIDATERYKLTEWRSWNGPHQQIFERLCGKEQIANGYSIGN